MSLVLALETSTAHASVALCDGDQVLASHSSSNPKTHSEFFNPAIQKCLDQTGVKLSEIELFAVGSGPGSFTGLRVSASIIKTFSMTFQKPLVAIDSLTLLKQEALLRGAVDKKILCLLNAHKNMNYVALFSGDQVELTPQAMTVVELNSLNFGSSQPVLCLGEGFTAYETRLSMPFLSQIRRDPQHSDTPLAQTLAFFGQAQAKLGRTIEWNSYEPLYIRASEAEENLKSKSY